MSERVSWRTMRAGRWTALVAACGAWTLQGPSPPPRIIGLDRVSDATTGEKTTGEGSKKCNAAL